MNENEDQDDADDADDDDHPSMRMFLRVASALAAEYNTFIVEYTILMAAARYKAMCILHKEAMLGGTGESGRRALANKCVGEFRMYLEQELRLKAEADPDRQP